MSLHWNAALFCSQLFFLRICLVVCHLKTYETDRSLHSAAVRAQTGSFGSLRNPCEQGTRDETRTAIEDVRDDWGRVMFYLTGDMSRVESLAIPLISP